MSRVSHEARREREVLAGLQRRSRPYFYVTEVITLRRGLDLLHRKGKRFFYGMMTDFQRGSTGIFMIHLTLKILFTVPSRLNEKSFLSSSNLY